MEFVTILIGAAVGAGFAYYGKRKKDGSEESDYNKIKQANTGNFYSSKAEHEKDLIDILKEITYGEELKNFKVMEKYREKAKYGYRRNGFTFVLTVSNGLIKCKIDQDNREENDKTVIEFEYDEYWSEFGKKKILRSVIENYSESEGIEVIENFMKKVSYETNWEIIGSELSIVDDLKYISETEKANDLGKNPSVIRKIDAAIHSIRNQIEDQDMALIFIETLEKVKEANKIISDSEVPVPIEVKRRYEELNVQDITALSNHYKFMTKELRENYKPAIFDTLKVIQNDANEIIDMFKDQKEVELKTLLTLINRRH